MSKISEIFKMQKAFIAFITGGDPDIDTTYKLIKTMADSGADIIEIGIPFSDPIAEGPIIQASSTRALQAGTTVDKLFEMVKKLRKELSIPLVFMTYANPVYAYGIENFMSKCKISGIDGLIVPDVPFEEKDIFLPACKKYGIELISMIAPTSSYRAAEIAKNAEGFLYCVSSLGVTGIRTDIGNSIADIIKKVKQVSDIPCAIGFGISSSDQAKEMAKFADGIIIGSAIVQIVEKYGKNSILPVSEYIKSIKNSINDKMEQNYV